MCEVVWWVSVFIFPNSVPIGVCFCVYLSSHAIHSLIRFQSCFFFPVPENNSFFIHSVNHQNFSKNAQKRTIPRKISGVCGALNCCLLFRWFVHPHISEIDFNAFLRSPLIYDVTYGRYRHGRRMLSHWSRRKGALIQNILTNLWFCRQVQIYVV